MGVSDLYTKGYRVGRRDTEARFAARIMDLETALREIVKICDVRIHRMSMVDEIQDRARTALAPEQDK